MDKEEKRRKAEVLRVVFRIGQLLTFGSELCDCKDKLRRKGEEDNDSSDYAHYHTINKPLSQVFEGKPHH